MKKSAVGSGVLKEREATGKKPPALCGEAAGESAKKAFLQRYCDNEREIARLEEELEIWEARAERVTTCFSHIRVDGGEGCDRIQYAVDILCELRAALADRLIDSTELRLEIARAIGAVSDARLRLLLEYRYIDGMTWERVSEALCSEYRWVLRLHKRALAAMELPERQRA